MILYLKNLRVSNVREIMKGLQGLMGIPRGLGVGFSTGVSWCALGFRSGWSLGFRLDSDWTALGSCYGPAVVFQV